MCVCVCVRACVRACVCVMCDNDFTTQLIILILSRYNSYTIVQQIVKTTELPLLMPTIPHPNKSKSSFKNSDVKCIMKFWYVN